MDEPDAGPNQPFEPSNDTKIRSKEVSRVHPSSQELERFFLGETERGVNRRIVRHLLTGCSTCGAVVAPFLRFAEVPLARPGGTECQGREDEEEEDIASAKLP